jgi:hypothetical protein
MADSDIIVSLHLVIPFISMATTTATYNSIDVCVGQSLLIALALVTLGNATQREMILSL